MFLFTASSFRILLLFMVTLHVPAEFAQIQDAIDASSSGDTVLVAPGEYNAVDFLGRNIVVISEQGPEYTSILPVGGEWANVCFDGGETAEAFLGGFAIIGQDSVGSRGVFILNASPTISDNWIINHKYVWDGCGIYTGNSNSIIENNLIMNNICADGFRSVYGGGICCTYACSLAIRNNVIAGNYAIFGGGIGTDHNASDVDLYLENNTIVDNTGGGNLYLEYGDDFTIRNCIIRGSEYSEIYLSSGCSLNIVWSDIEGGQDGICGGNVTWGEGMIDYPPVFTSGSICEYELNEYLSPCIDTGDPSPEYNDPENPLNPGYALYPSLGLVRNDMGAFGGGGVENWTGITTSPEEVIKSRISVVQNPCQDIICLRVNATNTQCENVMIMNLAGRIVDSKSIETSDTGTQFVSFSLHDLPVGMYAAFLETGTGDSACWFTVLR